MPSFRVATWNQNGWDKGREVARADLIANERIDLLCAQELNFSRYNALLSALGADWWGVSSLTAREGLPAPASYWGVAVFGRSAAVQRDGEADVIGDPNDDGGTGLFWRRTVTVPVMVAGTERVTAAAVHVRPGAVVGRQKLEFVSRLAGWLASGPRPLVMGVDANSPSGVGDADDDYWEVEKDVWSAAATHGLRDAWRLTASPFTPTHLGQGQGLRERSRTRLSRA